MPVTPSASLPVTILDSDREIPRFLDELRHEPIVAADMEFSSDTTRVLLMQFATEKHVTLLDPLSIQNLDPVLEWLADARYTKVFHSGQDDARMIARQYGAEVGGALDTQVYAAFCGFHYPIGLAALLDSILGITLSKGQQRSDWGARPLSQAQIRYAAADVIYLREIVARFDAQIAHTPKAQWAREESRRVVEKNAGFSVDDAAEWRFLDNYRDSRDRMLLALRLLDWSRSMKIPRARGGKRSVRPHDLERIMDDSDTDWLSAEHVNTIRAMREPDADDAELARLNRLPPPGPDAGERKARVTKLLRHIEKRCGEYSVSPAIVATKSAVEDLVRFKEAAGSVLTRGWRREMLGDLDDILGGHRK